MRAEEKHTHIHTPTHTDRGREFKDGGIEGDKVEC